MFTSVLMIEKPLTSADVEFVTTLHGDEPVSFVVLMQPRGDQATGCCAPSTTWRSASWSEAVREAEEPEGEEARQPAERALDVLARRRCATRAREAVGQVVEDHPLDALQSVVERDRRRRGDRADRSALRGGVLPPGLGLQGAAQGGRAGAQALRAQRSEADGPRPVRPASAAARQPARRAVRARSDRARDRTRETSWHRHPAFPPPWTDRTSSASAAPECRASRRSSRSAGRKVAGSDAKESATAEALRALGATVHIGHAAGHLADDATCVVVSSAIRADNPELAARRRARHPGGAPLATRSPR